MKAITPYTADQFGIDLPDACVTVREVNSNKDKSYYAGIDENGNHVYKNTIVRFDVYVSVEAFESGKQPICQGENFIDLAENEIEATHNTALNVLFPESVID